MNVSLYQAAAAMNASARWQDVISENLSATSTPGARRREISFAAIEAGLNPSTRTNPVVPRSSVGINFTPGQLRPSGAALDFAIDGKAFFELQLPDGGHAYTRDGEFHLNAQGQLVSKQGHLVLGDGGPIQFDPSNKAPVVVSTTGEVSQGEDVKGKLRMVEFADPQKLTMISSGYFLGTEEAGAMDTTTARVHQGFVEGSNVAPTIEMASLINAMRMFESNQRVLQMQDERTGRAITELTSPG